MFPLSPNSSESAALYRVNQVSADGASIVTLRVVGGSWTHVWEPVAGGGVTDIPTLTTNVLLGGGYSLVDTFSNPLGTILP